MNPAMVTTAFDFSGYRVQRNLGVVRGLTVRSRSALGNLAGSIQSMFGGNITVYTELCERARQEAFDLMMTHADKLGANAIIGMRYDANDIMDGITEVLAYGTAVVIAPVDQGTVAPVQAPEAATPETPPAPGPASASAVSTGAEPLSRAPSAQDSRYGSGIWGNPVAFRLTAPETPLYQNPSPSAPVQMHLRAGSVIVVAATTGGFYQVVTQDDTIGYITQTAPMTPVQE